MPYIPKSKSTQKKLRATMQQVREGSISIASAAANREKEAAKKRAKLYQDLKSKDFLLDVITRKIVEISKKNIADTISMYQIVSELCKDGVMDEIVFEVIKMIEEFDNNPENTIKINSSGISLVKTIEREYKLYMIEFLVRAEIEKMKEKGIKNRDIVNILNCENSEVYKAEGKKLRLRVRAVVRSLYCLPEEEQKTDKLRTETKGIMKNMAANIDFTDKQKEYQKSTKQIHIGSAPDTDNR